jgi:NTE family protein
MARAECFQSLGVAHRRRSETVAFVLPGGGSLAATQIGMLRGLGESRIVPHFVIGASAGALNAVGYAADPSTGGIDRLESLWRALRRHDIAPVSLLDVVRGLRGKRDWLVADTGLRKILGDELALRSFEDLAIPAHVVVTELTSGQAHVISHGDAVEALVASAALPGVFPPVQIAGRTFIDGGVSANAPVAQAVSLGATQIYVLPAAGPSQPGPGTQGALRVALRVLNQALRNVAVTDPQGVVWRNPDPGVHVLPAPAATSENFLDFRATDRLIDQGYQLTRQWLDHLEPASSAA